MYDMNDTAWGYTKTYQIHKMGVKVDLSSYCCKFTRL